MAELDHAEHRGCLELIYSQMIFAGFTVLLVALPIGAVEASKVTEGWAVRLKVFVMVALTFAATGGALLVFGIVLINRRWRRQGRLNGNNVPD